MTYAVIVDTEATDNDPKTASVIELAEMPILQTPRQFLEQRDTAPAYGDLYYTDVPIKLGAMAAHHILPSELVGHPPFVSYTLPDECSYVVGHNIDFDAELLRVPSDIKRICTLAMARNVWQGLDAYNQSALIYHIGTRKGDLLWARDRLKNAHRATDDVENCSELLRWLLSDINNTNPEALDSWEALWRFSEEARIPRIMSFGKHKGEPVANLPWSYVKWYMGTPDQDPYLVKAFRRCGFLN